MITVDDEKPVYKNKIKIRKEINEEQNLECQL